MKLLILTLILSCLSFGDIQKQEVKKTTTEYVYVCTGPSAKKYHKTQKCRGLSRCSGAIVKKSKTEAVKEGKDACKICYK